jgi:hypothetical protein
MNYQQAAIALAKALQSADQDKRCNLCQKESYDEPHDQGCPFDLAYKILISTTDPQSGKIYTLCVGTGADSGSWPEQGDWYVSDDFGKIVAKGKELGLNTEVWRNIDGKPYPHEVFPIQGPGTDYNCWAYADDKDAAHKGDLFQCADSVARVHVHEIL